MKISFATAAVLVFTLSMPLVAQESTRQDFDDFCQAWVGRWMSERTLVDDEPGFGNEGDKLTFYADCKVEHDGNAMVCTVYGGKGTGTWIVAYDAGDKKIKGLWVTSGGVFSPSVIYKQGDKWVESAHGSQADGTKIEVISTIEISDGGKTHTWKSTPIVGGKQKAEDVVIWHRVNK